MNTQQSVFACSLAFVLSISVSLAGPCSSEIDSAIADFESILNACAVQRQPRKKVLRP